MAKKHLIRKFRKAKKLLQDKRAVSVALSTMIITAGVVAMGIAILYWAYAWGKVATIEISNGMQSDSNAIEERIGYEYVSAQGTQVTVNIINWGKTGNVSVARVYIWDNDHNPVELTTDKTLMEIDSPNNLISGNTLNPRQEGKFTITTSANLEGNSIFTIRIVTERGRTFDYSFITAP
jgi:hypothetical protein